MGVNIRETPLTAAAGNITVAFGIQREGGLADMNTVNVLLEAGEPVSSRAALPV
jgi:hypothetical protein